MTRGEALEALTSARVALLADHQRVELLEQIQGANWDDAPGWESLTPAVQQQLQSPESPIVNPRDEAFDAALQMVLRHELRHVATAYLDQALTDAGVAHDDIGGEADAGVACPCCGRRTLDRRGDFDICLVCWWEDDGSDNVEVNMPSGPNHVTLLEGRLNVLRFGIYDPRRQDLVAFQHPPERYMVGRVFVLDQGIIYEQATSWSARVPIR
jgi:hypothetical protein